MAKGILRQGSEACGFTIDPDERRGIVRVEAWGFWDIALAQTLAGAALEGCRRARRPGLLYVDLARFKPQGQEGQAGLRALLAAARDGGVVRAAVVVTNAVTKLQLARLVREVGVSGWTCFSTESAALAALSGREPMEETTR